MYSVIVISTDLFVLTVGHTANYAVVVAQLHSKGVCHGIHPFIVQLRDEDTHTPMPGTVLLGVVLMNTFRGTCRMLGRPYIVYSRNTFVCNFNQT
jgi:hypothetical protein